MANLEQSLPQILRQFPPSPHRILHVVLRSWGELTGGEAGAGGGHADVARAQLLADFVKRVQSLLDEHKVRRLTFCLLVPAEVRSRSLYYIDYKFGILYLN